MYWDYLQIIKNNPIHIENLLSIIKNIKNCKDQIIGADIDMIILRTIFENYKNSYYYQCLNDYDESMKKKKNFFVTGPDFSEIKDELVHYGIKNISYINSLCNECEEYNKEPDFDSESDNESDNESENESNNKSDNESYIE
jgi:hypothetical protein